jgi:hypothetical protein
MKSWEPQVIADKTGKWCGNACRFATRQEADAYVTDLMTRWTSVTGWRSIESDDDVNYVWKNGKAKPIKKDDAP